MAQQSRVGRVYFDRATYKKWVIIVDDYWRATCVNLEDKTEVREFYHYQLDSFEEIFF